ncbi:MAG: helix-turn-helix domain-containing protein [Myxococcota bacterium]
MGPVPLTETEVALLRCLVAAGGRPVPREELLREVWGYAPGVRSRTVDTTVQRLRAKIEADPGRPRHLLTVRGTGYAWAEADDVAPPAASPPFPRLDRIVGREAELRALVGDLHAGHRLVTLTGPSGAGKTWAARRALTQIADLGRRAVWFAEAARAVTAADLLDAVAAALSLPSPLLDPDRQVREALRAGPTVGVVDDAQLLDDDALRLLSDWVRTLPELAVVVTSQRVLGLEGERRQPIEPLPADQAVALLRDRLEALAIPPPPSARLQALAERAGGLPLALELAAPLLDTVPVDQLLAEGDVLGWTAERPDADPRHRTLGAAIAASVARLEPRTCGRW